jgi:hypothetical protein
MGALNEKLKMIKDGAGQTAGPRGGAMAARADAESMNEAGFELNDVARLRVTPDRWLELP